MREGCNNSSLKNRLKLNGFRRFFVKWGNISKNIPNPRFLPKIIVLNSKGQVSPYFAGKL